MKSTKPLSKIVLLFIIVTCHHSSSFSSPPTKRSLAYGENASQELDLYLPIGRDNYPVMIYVHGGGWLKGDKKSVGKKPGYFTDLGWIFISINYRLLPEGGHPKNAEDVARAVAWVHENIGKYGGAANQIFLMGHSAGSHLASLVSTDEGYLKKHGEELGVIKGVIALDSSAYDVLELMKRNKHKLYVSVFGEDQQFQKEASPRHHVEKGKGIPPFLICYSRGIGTRKNPARRRAAISFQSTLEASAIQADLVDASDRSHKEINDRFGGPEDEKVTKVAERFLLNILINTPYGEKMTREKLAQ